MSPFDPSGILRLRQALDMNQATLGQHINVNQSTVCRWEAGHATPNANQLGTMNDLAYQNGVSGVNFFTPPGSNTNNNF